ncbi:MAG: hypothetical protein QHJ73_08910 [Armatimonadota bacterium]|nr:hypothetical protein [Armatimonadota bacterium]
MLGVVRVGVWDAVMLVAVSLQATTLAYLHHPRGKALVMSLPIPFTTASLALGRPVDATNEAALGLLLLFMHAVRVLHTRAGVPIVPSILLGALAYSALGAALARVLPPTSVAFWSTTALVLGVGIVLQATQPQRSEPGHRSPLPVWIKLPIIAGVIAFLILMKQALAGFMTLFPMVGVVAAYEARHSLWTMSRQMPVILITLSAMIVTVRLTQGHLGMGWALVLGWAAFFCTLVPLTRAMWSKEDQTATAAA